MGTTENILANTCRTEVMNGIFDSVELKMLEELAKRGSVTNKRSGDKKKYLKELIRSLYLNL